MVCTYLNKVATRVIHKKYLVPIRLLNGKDICIHVKNVLRITTFTLECCYSQVLQKLSDTIHLRSMQPVHLM